MSYGTVQASPPGSGVNLYVTDMSVFEFVSLFNALFYERAERQHRTASETGSKNDDDNNNDETKTAPERQSPPPAPGSTRGSPFRNSLRRIASASTWSLGSGSRRSRLSGWRRLRDNEHETRTESDDSSSSSSSREKRGDDVRKQDDNDGYRKMRFLEAFWYCPMV